MSDLEAHPVEQTLECGALDTGRLEILEPREVPLGGPRAMPVLRSLPNRPRRMIGAWCFADAYGPVRTGDGPGMAVPPHPHTGLQTVSWVLSGEIEHRDSVGGHLIVRPGGVAIMTAGRGISHSEYALEGEAPVLHGAQLWIALPAGARDGEPSFEGVVASPTRTVRAGAGTSAGGGASAGVGVDRSAPNAAAGAAIEGAAVGGPTAGDASAGDAAAGPGVVAVVGDAGATLDVSTFIGSFDGMDAGTSVHTPLVGVGLRADAPLEAGLALDESFEHGVLALTPGIAVDDEAVPVGGIAYLPPGTGTPVLTTTGAADAVLIGGVPFEDEIVMFWNFVAPSHDAIVEAREAWQRERDQAPDAAPRPRFGVVAGDPNGTLPAPELPTVRLRPRGRHHETPTGEVRDTGGE